MPGYAWAQAAALDQGGEPVPLRQNCPRNHLGVKYSWRWAADYCYFCRSVFPAQLGSDPLPWGWCFECKTNMCPNCSLTDAAQMLRPIESIKGQGKRNRPRDPNVAENVRREMGTREPAYTEQSARSYDREWWSSSWGSRSWSSSSLR